MFTYTYLLDFNIYLLVCFLHSCICCNCVTGKLLCYVCYVCYESDDRHDRDIKPAILSLGESNESTLRDCILFNKHQKVIVINMIQGLMSLNRTSKEISCNEALMAVN